MRLTVISLRRTVLFIMKPFSKASFTVIAGPCSVYSRSQINETAHALAEMGLSYLRGGAYKMRTSPDSWQGLGETGWLYLSEAAKKFNLKSVSEITSLEQIPAITSLIDVILVGTRNMQNYPLLKRLGETEKQIVLKRGMSSTIHEWVEAAKYITESGNSNIILCERGIRTFETYTRNTLDISAIDAIKNIADYPVIGDPSHATGRKEMVRPMAWALAAAGADGLMIECEVNPDKNRCDYRQTIDIKELREIIHQLPVITAVWKKKLI